MQTVSDSNVAPSTSFPRCLRAAFEHSCRVGVLEILTRSTSIVIPSRPFAPICGATPIDGVYEVRPEITDRGVDNSLEPLLVRPRVAWRMLGCGNTHGYALLNAGELESFGRPLAQNNRREHSGIHCAQTRCPGRNRCRDASSTASPSRATSARANTRQSLRERCPDHPTTVGDRPNQPCDRVREATSRSLNSGD